MRALLETLNVDPSVKTMPSAPSAPVWIRSPAIDRIISLHLTDAVVRHTGLNKDSACMFDFDGPGRGYDLPDGLCVKLPPAAQNYSGPRPNLAASRSHLE